MDTNALVNEFRARFFAEPSGTLFLDSHGRFARAGEYDARPPSLKVEARRLIEENLEAMRAAGAAAALARS